MDPLDDGVKELGKDLCMHVVFAKPVYLGRDDVPSDAIDKEREILLATMENDPKQAKKPEEIKKKIVEGKLGRFYSEQCLLEQPFIKEDKLTVGKYLAQQQKNAKIDNYSYIGLA